MKLTGLLKEKFDKAETIEEKRKVFREVGIELNDSELDFVSGGAYVGGDIDWMMTNGYPGPSMDYDHVPRKVNH